jgi:hypothetical protein
MSQLLSKLALCAALVSGSGMVAHAQDGTAINPPASAGISMQLAQSGDQSPSFVSTAPGARLVGPGGLCCAGVPVIPLGTPMREPSAPTAPGMPGQPAPIGQSSTLPPGQ